MINQLLGVMLILLSLIFVGILFIGLAYNPNSSSLSDEEGNVLSGSNLSSTEENVGGGYSTLGSSEEENITINESNLSLGEENITINESNISLEEENITTDESNLSSEESPQEGEFPSEESAACTCDSDLLNCEDFATQLDAQACFESCGGSIDDVNQLDENMDGVACDSLLEL